MKWFLTETFLGLSSDPLPPVWAWIFCCAVIHQLFGSTQSQSPLANCSSVIPQLKLNIDSYFQKNQKNKKKHHFFCLDVSGVQTVRQICWELPLLPFSLVLGQTPSHRSAFSLDASSPQEPFSITHLKGNPAPPEASGTSLWHFASSTGFSLPFIFRLLCWPWCSLGAEAAVCLAGSSTWQSALVQSRGSVNICGMNEWLNEWMHSRMNESNCRCIQFCCSLHILSMCQK